MVKLRFMLSSRADIIFLVLNWWLKPRMTKLLLVLFLNQFNWIKRNTALVIQKCSSELVFLATWKKLERIALALSLLGSKQVQEERLPVCHLKNCKIKSSPFIAAKEQLEIGLLAKLGNGGTFGWLLSLILNALSLVNIRLNLKIRLL